MDVFTIVKPRGRHAGAVTCLPAARLNFVATASHHLPSRAPPRPPRTVRCAAHRRGPPQATSFAHRRGRGAPTAASAQASSARRRGLHGPRRPPPTAPNLEFPRESRNWPAPVRPCRTGIATKASGSKRSMSNMMKPAICCQRKRRQGDDRRRQVRVAAK
uniref:Uncharacterized protein n=1 Tax=Setaria viridis TaxID=4556 RepID=A0A4U6W8X9_SETVI|nr:hypothetical protein SEVIR_1G039900v2 [Setaria viridis]